MKWGDQPTLTLIFPQVVNIGCWRREPKPRAIALCNKTPSAESIITSSPTHNKQIARILLHSSLRLGLALPLSPPGLSSSLGSTQQCWTEYASVIFFCPFFVSFKVVQVVSASIMSKVFKIYLKVAKNCLKCLSQSKKISLGYNVVSSLHLQGKGETSYIPELITYQLSMTNDLKYTNTNHHS